MSTSSTESVVSPVVSPPQSALLELHQAAGAELIAYGAMEIVSTFGTPPAEYAAIRKACGLMDMAHRAVLEVGGKDRHSFLNNFLTNHLWTKEGKSGTGIAAGTGVYAFLLNGKGRIVADMNALEIGESILLETDARLVPGLKTALEKYVFTEKVTFMDWTNAWSEIGLIGPGAIDVLQEQGVVIAEFPELGSRAVVVKGVGGWVFRDDVCGVPGYFLLVPRAEAAGVWKALDQPYAGQTNKRSLRPVGWAMFNATRVEAGRPLYGIDFTDASLPAETGLFERGVSVIKGCYLGQEVVARMHARSVVAKKLVGLKMSEDALPTAGAEVVSADGTQVGTVSSSTISPVLGGACLALATVKKGFFEVGTELKVAAEGAMRGATVVELPFVAAGGGKAG